MANTQLMQEELQQSVVLSEEDAEFEEDLPDDPMMVDSSAPLPSGNSGDSAYVVADHIVPSYGNDSTIGANMVLADETAPHHDAEGGLDGMPPSGGEAGDHDGETSVSDGGIHDDDDASDVDAEGEDDDDDAGQHHINPNANSSDEEDVAEGAADEDEDEDENEGVGAVKIKPGDEESDSDDDISLASGSSRESTAEWEEVVENDDEEEEEDSDAADPNNCIFCKKDEEHDPGVEFEAYLACKRCGEHGTYNVFIPVYTFL